jgi:hypothetical protein
MGVFGVLAILMKVREVDVLRLVRLGIQCLVGHFMEMLVYHLVGPFQTQCDESLHG